MNGPDKKVTVFLKFTLLLLHFVLLILVIPFLIISGLIYPFYKVYSIKIMKNFSSLYWQLEFLFFFLHNRLHITGLEKLNDKENYIICSNHLCGMDFNVIHYIAYMKSSLCSVKYLLKSSLLWIPLFGIGMFLDGFCFLSRNFVTDESRIKKFTEMFKNNNLKLWLILFPEGTRYTIQKKAESDKFCESRNITKFKNVLYPRHRGFDLVTKSLNHYVKNVVVISILYDGKVSSLFEMFCLSPSLTTVYARIDIMENNPDLTVVDVFNKIDSNLEEMHLSLAGSKLSGSFRGD
ncbi:putative 1-acyl-sn-glycerol-3-phosphate acyltransferase 4 [Cucumispora dikerogammari]|nr:putative 1-acyl-sn-glycerol-3-phosphate acyltransferase 4 [Cucumispora dikerogammari]